MSTKRVIVAITGASGVIYGVRALQLLAQLPHIETHLIFSMAAKRTLHEETDLEMQAVEQLADVVHSFRDIGATIASGSFITAGMLVAPCSIKTLSSIAHGFSDNLVSRAADVCLKEKRPLVLMVRETPFHQGHLESMVKAAQYGAIIAPPIPAFYTRPQSLDEVVTHSVGRALDLLAIENEFVNRWQGHARTR